MKMFYDNPDSGGYKMRKRSLFMLFAFLAYTSVSFGALNAYLTLAGQIQGTIDGGVTLANREGTIEVYGFSHLIFSPRSQATGLLTGQRQHEPLRFTKQVDRSTPLLMNAWVNNEKLTQFELRFYRPLQSGGEENYYTIILTNAYIVSIRQEILNNKYPDNLNYPVFEHVTVVYDSIEWAYESPAINSYANWEYAGAGVLISDLNGDGIVNLLDLGIFANQWLATYP
jgi:type VI secretion system secreted protein Hcp